MDRCPARILVVDDSRSTRKLMVELLQREGYSQVHEAEDGLHALACLAEQRYELIIADWQMPRLTGLGLLREVRKTLALRHIPVLMVTGVVTRSHIYEAFAAGANGFVTKPYFSGSLEEQVRLLLRPQREPPATAREAWAAD